MKTKSSSFATEAMSKVTVYASQKDIETVIDALHDLKLYHITKPQEVPTGKPLQDAELLATLLNQLQSIFSFYGIDPQKEKEQHGLVPLTFSKAKSFLQSFLKTFSHLHEQEKSLKEELQNVQEQLQQLQPFMNSPLVSLTPADLSSHYVTVIFGTVQNPEAFEQAVKEKTRHYELWCENNACVFVYDNAVDVAPIIKQYLTPLSLSFVQDMTYGDAYKQLLQKETTIKKELGDIKKQLALQEQVKKQLVSSYYLLRQTLKKRELPLFFGVSEQIFFIEGYVPSRKVARLKSVLDNVLKERYHIEETYVTRHEEAPIAFHHPNVVSPFSFFLHLYSLPSYQELDPTMLTFITFPLIFGAMLGDIGYGLTTLVIFLLLRSKMPKAKGFFDILIWSSFWTILFGFFFGEFFGAEEIFGVALPHVIHRMHDLNSLLVFSLIIGIVHVNLGLILGFINEKRHHGLKHAIFAKLSWIVLQIGAGLVGVHLVTARIPLWIGLSVILLAAIMLYLGEGINGLVELPGIFGNLLSYARIMAIGLASAGLAVVVNDFATQFFQKGVWGIIPAVLLLLIGHGINILLGIIGPFLHSLRLHYVEQFTKFYKGGGKPYQPFGGDE